MVPSIINAGETLKFSLTLTDYKASEWNLSFTLLNATGKITFAASAVGDTYQVNIPYTTTQGWAEGTYLYVAYVEKSGERFKALEGDIKIKPDFSTSATKDVRSMNRIILDNIEAVLSKRGTFSQLSYTIEGRTLQNHSLAELQALRREYQKLVNIEEGKTKQYSYIKAILS